ncbi:acetoacetate decarboxylase family protein [Natronoglomus mannanivorans]|uniref:Acetoacetate decarboxylase family protein n=1 Tax=Natronoglomus mannanivorans TaxID=2979990 RepID=A0AAP3E210_9EURY|nr:acetoacetate decarboxylase family protein [Halobacteria archaeon AArc-xg1-1]
MPSESDRFVRLSTGETITFPVRCRASVVGAAFLASAPVLERVLPDELAPIRVTPTRALVVFAAVAYDHVDGVDSYDEFAAIVPAVVGSGGVLSMINAVTGTIGGYVTYLPVTTESGKALGTDVWGFPKEVADVTITDEFGIRRARVETRADGESEDTEPEDAEPGEHVVSLSISPPRTTRHRSISTTGFARRDGSLLAMGIDLRGDLAIRPFGHATLEVGSGTHPITDHLAALEIGRSVATFGASDLGVEIHPGRWYRPASER